ncbi:MAG TPA: TIGR03619 family F420-dependent LLM class oxidoreductase [Gaiellales bacterium]|nr:TIGR03619 family F420-dependent LLM class oxidoreductase [Gaiellales bacterium]
MTAARVVLVLSENWTIVSARDLPGLVDIAVEAEAAGVDTVMLSEHVVLGASSAAHRLMSNPRDYAAPGNQDPATPWPDSMLLAAAIAARTERIRIALAAIIAPLRHPLLLAKQLATLDLLCRGRLIVQPTVSWDEQEYAALGVPFRRRGAILDEQLAAMGAAWSQTPASFAGRAFRFSDVYLEPKPFRPEGPRMWFGGMRLHPPLLRRLVRYGSGFHPFGSPTGEELAELRRAMAEAGRDIAELEMIGGIRGTFSDGGGVADLDQALEAVPAQLAQGYTAICFKPNQYTDERAEVGALCRRVVAAVQGA